MAKQYFVVGCGAEGLTAAITASLHKELGETDVILVDVDNTPKEELDKLGYEKVNYTPIGIEPFSALPEVHTFVEEPTHFHRHWQHKRGKNKRKHK